MDGGSDWCNRRDGRRRWKMGKWRWGWRQRWGWRRLLSSLGVIEFVGWKIDDDWSIVSGWGQSSKNDDPGLAWAVVLEFDWRLYGVARAGGQQRRWSGRLGLGSDGRKSLGSRVEEDCWVYGTMWSRFDGKRVSSIGVWRFDGERRWWTGDGLVGFLEVWKWSCLALWEFEDGGICGSLMTKMGATTTLHTVYVWVRDDVHDEVAVSSFAVARRCRGCWRVWCFLVWSQWAALMKKI